MNHLDFTKLTDKERQVLDEYLKFKNLSNGSIGNLKKSWDILEKAPKVKYYLSLFPNQRVFPSSLHDKTGDKSPEEIVFEFKNLVESPETIERQILRFIKENNAQFIPTSIAKNNTNWGHHELFAFSEFQLSISYKADFLIVGKNSDGYHFMFVEFESPHGSISLNDGTFGIAIRRGVKQVSDWEYWLQSNFVSLRLEFERHKSDSMRLPKDFTVFDSSRISYAVVCGLRKDFDDRTYREKRELRKNRSILLLHYENLIDYSLDLVREKAFGMKKSKDDL